VVLSPALTRWAYFLPPAGPHKLADLILKHNPCASLEMIANVISEWGDLFDDHRFVDHESIDIESAPPNDRPQTDI
jgi:hypothetical protein